MDKIENRKSLLEAIRLSEGTEFEYDEKAILTAYKNQDENTASLAIKILSIFGGFLASLTFLGFIALGGFFESENAITILGIVFIVSAIGLNIKYDKLIIDTFSISIYVIGFCLLFFGLTQLKVDENIALLIVITIAFSSLCITQNYMLSFISILTINGGLLGLIFENDVYNLINLYIAINGIAITYFFLNEAKIISTYKRISRLYNPARIGLIFSFLFGLISVCKKGLTPISENYIWLSSIALFFLIIYIVNAIIEINEVTVYKKKVFIYLLTALVLIPTVFSPAISGAILLILLSFFVNYKSGFVIGILSLIYFIAQYYYDLNFTLLTKSILLFSSGIVFIGCYIFTTKNIPTNEKI
jgi:hypothetical protein